jgi:hypothetical protein
MDSSRLERHQYSQSGEQVLTIHALKSVIFSFEILMRFPHCRWCSYNCMVPNCELYKNITLNTKSGVILIVEHIYIYTYNKEELT